MFTFSNRDNPAVQLDNIPASAVLGLLMSEINNLCAPIVVVTNAVSSRDSFSICRALVLFLAKHVSEMFCLLHSSLNENLFFYSL